MTRHRAFWPGRIDALGAIDLFLHGPYFRMSLKNEVTTYPFGDETAVIPSYNVSLLLDALEINATLGYGVRKGYEHGGFCGGGGLTLRF